VIKLKKTIKVTLIVICSVVCLPITALAVLEMSIKNQTYAIVVENEKWSHVGIDGKKYLFAYEMWNLAYDIHTPKIDKKIGYLGEKEHYKYYLPYFKQAKIYSVQGDSEHYFYQPISDYLDITYPLLVREDIDWAEIDIHDIEYANIHHSNFSHFSKEKHEIQNYSAIEDLLKLYYRKVEINKTVEPKVRPEWKLSITSKKYKGVEYHLYIYEIESTNEFILSSVKEEGTEYIVIPNDIMAKLQQR
jgi:hypothetical protein